MDIRCIWCQTVCHDDCSRPVGECNLGLYQQYIIPPTSVTIKVGPLDLRAVFKPVCVWTIFPGYINMQQFSTYIIYLKGLNL